jgi:protein O-mannosyl-transferase
MGSSFIRTGTRSDHGPGRALAASVLAVALLTLAAYWPVQRNGFILFDDEDYIGGNAVVKAGLTARGIALAFTSSYAANWFPLTWMSHMVDVELFGLAPRGHHLDGLAIHLATAVILLLTLRAMTGRAGPSFLVAALFAIHPLHVESVAWASERKDVLSACFWMLTTAAYLRYTRRPGAGRYLAVLLLFALGLMAKQMLVTLPLVLLLLDWWPLGRHASAVGAGPPPTIARLLALALEKIPFLALAALGGLLALKAQGDAGLVHSLSTFPLAARLANAILAPVRYLVKTVWPTDFSIFYPFVGYPLGQPRVIAAGGLLLAASAAVVPLRRRHPWLLTGWLWYLVTLLPVVGLIQVGDQAIADRYTYLPLVGIFIACSWSLAGASWPRSLPGGTLTAVAATALLVLVGITRRQVEFWRDDRTLFGHAALVTRDNWLAVHLIGRSLERDGDADGALQRYRETIRLKPDYEQAWLRLAGLLHQQGRAAETLAELRAAVAAVPRSRDLRRSLVLALREQGSFPEATAEQRAAVTAFPEDRDFRMSLALTLADQGLEEEAILHLRESIRLWPNFPEAYNNLAALLVRRGQVEEAVALLRRALEIEPSYPDARINLEALSGRPGQ